MDSKNLYAALEAAPLDPAVGIRLACLSGGEDCALFAAEIAPGTRLSAHYHRKGSELYLILAGTGRMSLGRAGSEGNPEWTDRFDVNPGDAFAVQPGQVHQLHNTGRVPMNALFACSPSHVTTDRTVLP